MRIVRLRREGSHLVHMGVLSWDRILQTAIGSKPREMVGTFPTVCLCGAKLRSTVVWVDEPVLRGWRECKKCRRKLDGPDL